MNSLEIARKLTRPLIATALLIGFSACATSSHFVGHTEYLHAIGGGGGPSVQANPLDTISYWDGDGVPGDLSVRINLDQQKAFFYKDNQLVGLSMISSGREGYRSSRGSFSISQKSANHRSNLFGDIVDANGYILEEAVDIRRTTIPPGARFVGASMPYFLRYNQGEGMHAGYLPGYPASGGCIRLPDHIAERVYANATVGTPVIVE